MNTRTSKFLAIVAVLAMAFAAFAVLSIADHDEATDAVGTFGIKNASYDAKVTNATIGNVLYYDSTSKVISGYANKVSEANMGETNYAGYVATNPPTGYDYAIEYTIELGTNENVYLSWINSHDGSLKSEKYPIDSGKTYCTMLQYIKESNKAGSKSFVIGDEITTVAAFNDAANKYTISWDVDLYDVKVIDGAAFVALDTDSDKKITLDKDYFVSTSVTVNDSLEIVMNGHKLYSATDLFHVGKAGDSTINFKIKGDSNSAIIVGEKDTQDAVLFVPGSNTATVNITVDGGKYFAPYGFVTGNCGTSKVYKGDVSYSNLTFVGVGFGNGTDERQVGIWPSYEGNNKLTVENVNITVEGTNSVGIYVGVVKTADIKNAVVVSGGNALEIKSGTVTVTGGSFTTSAYAAVTTASIANGNGTGSGVAAVLINNKFNTVSEATAPSNVEFKGVALDNTASKSKQIIIGLADETNGGDITFKDDAAHTIQIAKYKNAVDKKVILNSAVVGDVAIAATVKVDVSGSLTNNGIIENKGTLACLTTAAIDGSGTIQNYETLTSGMTATNNHTTLCTVEVYPGSTWNNNKVTPEVYVSTGDSGVITIGEEGTKKILSTKMTMNSAGTSPSSAVFDVYGAITVNTGAWLDNGYADTVTVDETGVINVNDDLTIGKDDSVTFKTGGSIVPVNKSTPALLTVNGKVYYADSSQIYVKTTVGETGEVKVEGESGSPEEEVVVVPDSSIVDGKIDQKTFDDNTGADVIVTTATISQATVPAGKTVVINAAPATNAVLNVAAENSEITVKTVTAATFTVNTGAGIIKLSGVTGTFNFYKGSIVVEAKEWTGGDMELEDGDVLKMSGVVDADVKITVKAEGTATVIVEEGDEKTLTIKNGHTLTIDEGVTLQIDGTVTAETAVGTGALEVKENATVNGTLSANVTPTKELNVYGKFTRTATLAATYAKLIAHSNSNINTATVDDETKVEGKDANGGFWKISTTTLVLNNYSGKYNFGVIDSATGKPISAGFTGIKITGDNKITYKPVKEYDVSLEKYGPIFGSGNNFSGITTIDTASLDLSVDYSNLSKVAIEKANVVFSAAADFKLDGVDVKVTVKGTNAENWTDPLSIQLTVVDYGAGATYGFNMYDSTFEIDVFSAYESDYVYAVKSSGAGVVNINNSSLTIYSAGVGIYTTGTATIDSSEVYISGASEAFHAGVVTVKNSDVDFIGDVEVTKLDLYNKADILVNGLFKAKNFAMTQDSILSVKDLFVDGSGENKSTIEKGTLTVSGDALIMGELVNDDVIKNLGNMGVYGTFTNNAGFENSGNFYVFAKEALTLTDHNTIEITDLDKASAAGKVKVQKITLDDFEMNANGSVAVKASISFIDKDGTIVSAKGPSNVFTGTLTLSDLVKTTDKYYTLELTNGTATVKVTYKEIKTPESKTGKSYTVDIAGKITSTADVDYDLENNAADKTIADKVMNLADVSSANFITGENSKIDSEGVSIIYASATYELRGAFGGELTTYLANNVLSAIFIGDFITNGAVQISGNIIGDVTAKGAVQLDEKIVMLGAISAEGPVTITGTIEGKINTKDSVTINAKGKVYGDIEVTVGTTPKSLTVAGVLDGNLIFNSEYLAKSTDKPGEETVETSKMTIDADMSTSEKTFVIGLGAAKNATSTAVGEAGTLSITTVNAPAITKYVKFALTQGKLTIGSITLPERYELVIEKDTTIEVPKGYSFDVKSAALKVSKDATSNFETGSGIADKYGKVTYVMTFDIEGGAYTIYSDVAYALTSCDEGAELTLGSAAVINSNVTVKDGVSIIVDGVKLDFQSYQLEMGEGAKIVLKGASNLAFAATGDNGKPADKDWEFYTISGTIVYDDANILVLDDVRFNGASTIAGVAATSTAASKINATLQYNEGMATVSAGYGTGSITLSNAAYYLTKADEDSGDVDKKVLVSGTFVIGADAVFDAVSISDAFAVVDYKLEAGETVPVIDKYRLKATIVGVEGILNLSATTSVKGVYAGIGVINLAAGKEFILAKSDKVPAGTDTNKTVPGNVMAKIVDTTDDQNGYVLNAVSAEPDKTLALKATTQKVGGLTINVMTLKGDVGFGAITATTSAFLDGVKLYEETALFGDDVFIIGASESVGMLCAKEIYMKEDGISSDFATLAYEVTFVEGEYTVYTYFASVDFEDVSDITIAKDLSISGMTDGDKLDLSGMDVNIVIAEGKKLTIDLPLIIGTPIDSFGAIGSSISGKVVILSSQYESLPEITKAYRYIVAYADVDLSEAEIYQANGKDEAVYSLLVVDDVLYATVFANEGTFDDTGDFKYKAGVGLAVVDKSIIPDIEGYIFTKWSNLNDDPNAAVGETNAYANAKAITVSVTVKFVTGITYYCNGIEFAVYDTPVKVEYNSVFTAKISDISKYQGTPLVNGKNSLIITDDTVIVGSGVEPIPVPPEPEPEPVVGDSGLSLTDILLIVLVVLIAIMVVILVLRLNRS